MVLSSEKKNVHVALAERSYDIQIGQNLLAGAGAYLASLRRVTHAVIITDSHVEHPHARAVAGSLAEAIGRVDIAVIEPGESSKSVEMANLLWQRLLAFGADRKTVVVAVGGGVIGDLAGFVAATFARGLDFLQIPTSLLAQVDSSVGGKTGVNLPHAKNMVGAFWQPIGVLIDARVLETLPEREFRAGLAEVVKYGVILDADFFAYLELHVEAMNARRADVMQHIIARCCRLKADVVADDERETTGRRAVLNYGHTIGHAIEAETGYGQFLHGEAVALGMHCAARLAESLGRVDSAFTRRQRELLTALHLPTTLPALDHQRLIAAMQRDKKVEHGQLRFVLPARMGAVELVSNISSDVVARTLADCS